MLRFGLLLAAIVLAFDQASKYWLIGLLAETPGGIEIAPFFSLVLVWNKGISFGLFGQTGAELAQVLVALALLVVGILLLWLGTARRYWPASALGLVIGGALGNIVDRVRYGAVADFFDLHWLGYHWPAFNLADTAIVVGVVMLLIDGLSAKAKPG
jgi:signal peptidase II